MKILQLLRDAAGFCLLVAICWGLLVIVAASAEANTDDTPGYLANNMGHDFASCAAYYMRAAECARNTRPNEPLGNQLDLHALRFMSISEELTSREVTKERIIMEYDRMYETISGRCENISLLMLEYNSFCPSLISDPDSRAIYWMEGGESP